MPLDGNGRSNRRIVEIVEYAFPVAFVFAFGGKIVHSFLSMGFDGVFKL